MVQALYTFIYNCWSWIPIEVYALFSVFILITCADSVFGLIDRGWRIFGR